jgi:glycine/D-amino acid oxidase-like deaminating enzyme
MPPRYGQSPWLDQFPKTRRPTYPKLTTSFEIPVAIVGGGLTGCATAYALAAAGIRTAVFEADRIAAGATAQAAGLMFATPSVDYLTLEKTHGRRVARALWRDTRRAALDGQAVVRRLKIRSNLHPAEAIVVARTEAEAKALRKEHAALRDAGIDGAWITAKALAQATGFEGVGGLKTAGHAWLDPYRTAHGLSRAAAIRGAAIFERTPISAVRHGRAGVELASGKIAIKAGTVVVATGSAAPLFKALARHFVEAETYAVLTPTLGASVRRAGGSRKAIVIDRAEPPHRLCWTEDDRILWTGADQARVAERLRDATLVQRTGQLMYELLVALPAISGVQPEFGWHAPWNRSVDDLPFIGAHRNYPHHLFALGLGTNLATAFLASRILARACQGSTDKSDEYFGFARIASRR